MNPDVLHWRRSPGRGKYAKSELERRFLVTGTPPVAHSTRLIEDRYLVGTRLRLRRLTVDGESIWKLTQKVRSADGGPAEVATTNTYLSGEEFEQLLGLPAHLLVKTREVCLVAGTTFAVDTFHGPLGGLRLAEIEVVDLGAPLAIPVWLGREVTHEDRFSGGRLAAATSEEVAALLASIE